MYNIFYFFNATICTILIGTLWLMRMNKPTMILEEFWCRRGAKACTHINTARGRCEEVLGERREPRREIGGELT